MKLILASKSPRRKEILQKNGYSFEILDSSFLESDIALSPVQTAINNALGKATATFNSLTDKSDSVVLGADTVVYFNDVILGKPSSKEDAVKMLKTLSNATHVVVTGYAIVSYKESVVGHSKSQVTFNDLSPDLISKYVESGLPLDKAGAYGIQDPYPLVESYKGSLSNIIGLPIEEIIPLLDKALKG